MPYILMDNEAELSSSSAIIGDKHSILVSLLNSWVYSRSNKNLVDSTSRDKYKLSPIPVISRILVLNLTNGT